MSHAVRHYMRDSITTTIDPEGSVELPRKYLEKHHLKPGSTVQLEERGEELVIKPNEPRDAQLWHALGEFAGVLKATNVVEELLIERRADTKREDDKFRTR